MDQLGNIQGVKANIYLRVLEKKDLKHYSSNNSDFTFLGRLKIKSAQVVP